MVVVVVVAAAAAVTDRLAGLVIGSARNVDSPSSLPKKSASSADILGKETIERLLAVAVVAAVVVRLPALEIGSARSVPTTSSPPKTSASSAAILAKEEVVMMVIEVMAEKGGGRAEKIGNVQAVAPVASRPSANVLNVRLREKVKL